MPLARALLVVALVFALASCWRAHRLGVVSADVPKCDVAADCPYGFECDHGACRASECDDYRACENGGSCTYEDQASARAGWGTCN